MKTLRTKILKISKSFICFIFCFSMICCFAIQRQANAETPNIDSNASGTVFANILTGTDKEA